MSKTYSFADIGMSFTGPGLDVTINQSSDIADEGITITPVGPRSEMVTGASGGGLHNLYASTASTVVIRLLRTSPLNAAFSQAYASQTRSSLLHGRNEIMLRDPVRGDFLSLGDVAFQGMPELSYAKSASVIEWTFDALTSKNMILGSGTPER